MNVILLEPGDYLDADRALIRDHRARHIREFLGDEPGRTLKIGLVDGLLGSADIVRSDAAGIELRVRLEREPPPKLPLTVVLALPRPKMLKRIFRSVAEFGVRELILVNSYKVEKSYWQSPALEPAAIRQFFLDGLQQSGDTVLPTIRCERRFKPFVEDYLPGVIGDSVALLAHPGTDVACPVALNRDCTLAIGPEGGFTQYEVDLLRHAGMAAVHLGPRILRVENAIPALVSRLFT